MIQCYNTQKEREKQLNIGKTPKKARLCKTCKGKGCEDCGMRGFFFA